MVSGDIASAVLHLHIGRNGVHGRKVYDVVHALHDSWKQETVTWNSRLPLGNELSRFLVSSNRPQTYSLDVAGHVRAEAKGDGAVSFNLSKNGGAFNDVVAVLEIIVQK